MTGWDWCKAVFNPEVVGYYNVSGNLVAFTTKAGQHHDLQVDDFADVEHGKALVAAVIAGELLPVKQVVELPTLDDVMGLELVAESKPKKPKALPKKK
jgi:hypothetical protein